jgi:hypothetical protein
MAVEQLIQEDLIQEDLETGHSLETSARQEIIRLNRSYKDKLLLNDEAGLWKTYLKDQTEENLKELIENHNQLRAEGLIKNEPGQVYGGVMHPGLPIPTWRVLKMRGH